MMKKKREQKLHVKKLNKPTEKNTMFCLNNDVKLLTDVFQNYISTCKDAFGINPVFCYRTPSCTWKAGLKSTRVDLVFVTDDKLRILLEENMSRGLHL